ncbi:hypothetical protein HD557_001934 [Nocardioides luteus]|nr:hypothetical protein [Nocardioides luteus]
MIFDDVGIAASPLPGRGLPDPGGGWLSGSIGAASGRSGRSTAQDACKARSLLTRQRRSRVNGALDELLDALGSEVALALGRDGLISTQFRVGVASAKVRHFGRNGHDN